MHILYSIQDNFAPYLAASMCSLFENHKDRPEITVHIILDGVSAENCNRLLDLAEIYGRKLCFYDFESIRDRIEGKVDTGRFPATIMARLFMGSLLPESIDKVLYLDSDTIVSGNISRLYDMPMGSFTAFMAAEPTIYPETRKLLGIIPGAPYFNSGVILVSLKKWRREGIENACAAAFSEYGDRLTFADQDVLNIVVGSNTRCMPQTFNFFSNYYYFTYSSLTRLSPWYAGLVSPSAFRAAKAAPRIIHFAGAERPWIHGSRNPYKAIYEKYAALTPFAGMPEISGQELSMLCYHAMNLATYCCPHVRSLASHAYYNLKLRRK